VPIFYLLSEKKVFSAWAVDINQFYAAKAACARRAQRSFLMKTKRGFSFGLPAVLLVLGLVLAVSLVLAGCDDGSSGGSSGVSKMVTITNISGISGTYGAWVLPALANPPANVAIKAGTISGATASFALTVPQSGNPVMETERRWTGSGDYYVALVPISGGSYQQTGIKITKNKVTFAADVSTVTLHYGNEFEAYNP
jgi:hypothetical protein